jgi:tetratricopeptide (TPR) repeat protein
VTSTPAPTATPTPLPTAACPPSGSPQLIQPAQFLDYPAAIQQFLSAGGDVATLRSELMAWGALPSALNQENEAQQVISEDLTGDGAAEIAVAVMNPEGPMLNRPTALLVFGCQAGAYVRLKEELPEDEEMGIARLLRPFSDMNRDGVPDLIYVERSCGAHTCFETLHILVWDGAAFSSLMGGQLTMPYPTYTITPGRIEAQSGGIGSVGAEPQRGYSEVWEWNGSVLTVTEQVWAEPTYRYHALLDGDRALLNGEYETAIAAYERVIDDDTLEEWGGISGGMAPADERDFLSAFARWRLVLTHLQMGDVSSAQAAYNQLQAEHPAGATGHDVTAMAETFWNIYLENDSVTASCKAVVAATSEDDPIIQFFNQSYGYANPWWEPVDLCPFTQ